MIAKAVPPLDQFVDLPFGEIASCGKARPEHPEGQQLVAAPRRPAKEAAEIIEMTRCCLDQREIGFG